MNTYFLNYYIFKDILHNISSNITYSIETSNNYLFHYALFYNVDYFFKLFNPFKKDSYQINQKIKNNFENFFFECLENAYKHAEDEEKVFCYFLLNSHLIEQNLAPYVTHFISRKHSETYVRKNLDSYLFFKNEKMAITKINVADFFFNAFSLSENDLNLITKPIKRIIGFFCVDAYYQECYHSAMRYYDFAYRSKTGIKKLPYFFYDLFFNHRKGKPKAKTFLYHAKIDTTILNLNNTQYVYRQKLVSYSFDELYQLILKKAKVACQLLNNYFNYEQKNKEEILKFLHSETI